MSSREASGRWIFRYPALVRVSHWLNLVCLVILLMSGLQIFNAHPQLYWGEASDFDRPTLSISAAFTADGRPIGVTRIAGRTFETTGVLGWSTFNGRPAQRAFPAWLTIPGAQDLATGRVWHFFFAWLFVINGLLYIGHSVSTGRLSRDLWPNRTEWRSIGPTIRDHLRLRLDQHSRYNVIQKLTYLVVILVLAPAVILSGLTMSPAVVTAAPWLLDIFGGRQSARTAHFIVAGSLVLFVFAHVVMILVSGFFNNVRSMITGWYGIAGEAHHEAR